MDPVKKGSSKLLVRALQRKESCYCAGCNLHQEFLSEVATMPWQEKTDPVSNYFWLPIKSGTWTSFHRNTCFFIICHPKLAAIVYCKSARVSSCSLVTVSRWYATLLLYAYVEGAIFPKNVKTLLLSSSIHVPRICLESGVLGLQGGFELTACLFVRSVIAVGHCITHQYPTNLVTVITFENLITRTLLHFQACMVMHISTINTWNENSSYAKGCSTAWISRSLAFLMVISIHYSRSTHNRIHMVVY